MSAAQMDAFGVEAETRPEDLYSLYLRETHGLPDGWRWWEGSSSTDEVPEGFVRFRGAVAPLNERTGEPNWRKKDKETERTFFVKRDDFEAWSKARAERLNECLKCRGTGVYVYGWHRDHGRLSKTCPQCNGSGEHNRATGGAA